MDAETHICPCGCGREVTERTGRGRPRRYYEKSCAKRAERDRLKNSAWIPAVAHSLHVSTPSPDKQVELAVLELSVIAGAFYRLSSEASPRLALSCERTFVTIAAALDEHFPGWNL